MSRKSHNQADVGLAFISAAMILMTFTTSCSTGKPGDVPNIPTMSRSVKCIELSKPGLDVDSVDSALVELAVADAKKLGRSIRLYKVVVGSTAAYYVFHMDSWSDVYSVYQTDSERSHFVGKYQYASLHYPCAGSSGLAVAGSG